MSFCIKIIAFITTTILAFSQWAEARPQGHYTCLKNENQKHGMNLVFSQDSKHVSVGFFEVGVGTSPMVQYDFKRSGQAWMVYTRKVGVQESNLVIQEAMVWGAGGGTPSLDNKDYSCKFYPKAE